MRRFVAFVLLLMVAGTGAAVWELRRPYQGYSSAGIFVDLPRGTSRREIARILAQNGVIASPLVFELYSRWHATSLKAGEYMFDQPVSAREVFWRIAAGRVYVHVLTIPEGWTRFDIADALEREGLCRREDFLAASDDPTMARDLAPGAQSLEGFLFPATYQFPRHITAQQVAAVMVERFRAEWAMLGQSSGAAGPREEAASQPVARIVTMASLVERETPRPDERPLVASVFYNRIEKGYPLQSDPTVQYALELAGRTVRKVHAGDLKFASPYNTYLHSGWPPGPIASPGEASLRAALQPAQTDYFYFVANTQGGHFFSSTLEEHNRNVTRYRHLLAGQPETIEPADPPQPPRAAASNKQSGPRRTAKTKVRKNKKHRSGQ
jgi:UPF0755 protein